MTWETLVQTWSNTVVNWIGDVISYTDKVSMLLRLAISIILIVVFYVLNRKKKNALKESLSKSLPRICVVFVIFHFGSFLYDWRFSLERFAIVFIYFLCVSTITTLFYWSICYAKACVKWDKHPQRTAFLKSWPIWFIVLTVISLVTFLIYLVSNI